MAGFLDITGLTLYDTNIKTYIGNIETELASDLAAKADTTALAAVAFSGDYGDLSNVPVIPVVPTNVSDFTNDAGYITNAGLLVTDVQTKATASGSYSTVLDGTTAKIDLSGYAFSSAIPTVATAIADNDSGYATGDQVYDYVQANKGDTNVIESISVNGTAQTITNKGVNISVPVVAQAIASGDTGYATGTQVFAYSEDKLNKVTSISQSSTNVEYPSALAVKTYVDTTVSQTLGDLETFLASY